MIVSVIVPTFGEPLLLSKALESVFSQSYQELELIVVDDNDPTSVARKKTQKIIENLIQQGRTIRYLKHKKNQNGAVARNTGLSHAVGAYIAFLDSDDEYHPNRIEKLVAAIQECDATVAGVYSGCEFRRQGKRYLIHKSVKTGRFLVETLACSFMFSTGSNIFVRREVLEDLGGFDESFTRHQDYELLVRLFQKYTLYALSEVLVIKNNENFNLPDVESMIAIKEAYLNKYADIVHKLPEKERRFVYQKNFLSIVEHALNSKRRDIAFIYYRKATTQGHLNLREYLRCAALYFRSWVR